MTTPTTTQNSGYKTAAFIIGFLPPLIIIGMIIALGGHLEGPRDIAVFVGGYVTLMFVVGVRLALLKQA